MNVVVNGEERELAGGTTLTELLGDMGIGAQTQGVAVARNGDVIARSQWQTVALAAGDHVEVLHAVQGG